MTEREAYMTLARAVIRTSTDRDRFAAWWKAEKPNRQSAGLTSEDEAELVSRIKTQIGASNVR